MRRPVMICEVGPRDGLQNAARTLPPSVRAEFVNRLAHCGVKRIEVGSFVNPRAVPQMADTEAVIAAIERVPGVGYSALALNKRGAERALAMDLDEIRFAVVSTETFNQRNQGSSVADSLNAFGSIAELARAAGLRISCAIGASFGCPFEGEVKPERVRDLAVEIVRRGTDEIVFADTIGVAVPQQVETLLKLVADTIDPAIPVGCHFHDTRGTGLANADAALRSGVALLDASVGGIGGCPFAPGAAGNVATEDVGYLMRQSGVDPGLDLQGLIDVGVWLGTHLGHRMPGSIASAGLFPEVAGTRSKA